MSDLRQREGDQPLPVPNDEPDIQSMVVADIEERKKVGLARYGSLLKANNGRDALRDLYEELLDACMYVRQVIAERDGNPSYWVNYWRERALTAEAYASQIIEGTPLKDG